MGGSTRIQIPNWLYRSTRVFCLTMLSQNASENLSQCHQSAWFVNVPSPSHVLRTRPYVMHRETEGEKSAPRRANEPAPRRRVYWSDVSIPPPPPPTGVSCFFFSVWLVTCRGLRCGAFGCGWNMQRRFHRHCPVHSSFVDKELSVTTTQAYGRNGIRRRLSARG